MEEVSIELVLGVESSEVAAARSGVMEEGRERLDGKGVRLSGLVALSPLRFFVGVREGEVEEYDTGGVVMVVSEGGLREDVEDGVCDGDLELELEEEGGGAV